MKAAEEYLAVYAQHTGIASELQPVCDQNLLRMVCDLNHVILIGKVVIELSASYWQHKGDKSEITHSKLG